MQIGKCAAGVTAGVAAAVLILLGGHAIHAAEVSSTWTSDFGKLDLTVTDSLHVRGNYPDYDGRIRGTMSEDGEIWAYWLQPTSGVRCQTEVYGTYYWGVVLWNVTPNGDLKGKWSYCDEAVGVQGAWNGQLKAGPSPMVMIQNASKGGSSKQGGGRTASTNPEDAVLDLLDALIRNAQN